MSLEIDMENYANLSSVFEEIERTGERRKLTETAKSEKTETKPRSSTVLMPSPAERHNLRRHASDPTRHAKGTTASFTHSERTTVYKN